MCVIKIYDRKRELEFSLVRWRLRREREFENLCVARPHLRWERENMRADMRSHTVGEKIRGHARGKKRGGNEFSLGVCAANDGLRIY